MENDKRLLVSTLHLIHMHLSWAFRLSRDRQWKEYASCFLAAMAALSPLIDENTTVLSYDRDIPIDIDCAVSRIRNCSGIIAGASIELDNANMIMPVGRFLNTIMVMLDDLAEDMIQD